MRRVPIEEVFTWMFPVKRAPFFLLIPPTAIESPVHLFQLGYQALGNIAIEINWNNSTCVDVTFNVVLFQKSSVISSLGQAVM